jgi:NAD(P)-dependent dehydrogenase (short-subunit alcohol dehydrogenase family)
LPAAALLLEKAAETIALLRAGGVRVDVEQVDVSDSPQVAALIQRISTVVPLAGIVHAAGVIDDGVLFEQTAERFAAVARPKAAGAWHFISTRGICRSTSLSCSRRSPRFWIAGTGELCRGKCVPGCAIASPPR